MNIGNWLIRLGGAREDVLGQAPGDVPKQMSLGAVIVGTAVMAAISATFALTTAVHLPVPVAMVVGLLWGLLILNLDRMLVVSMGRRSGIWANIGTAVPRVLLALLIGTVISLPLVLRIFDPEITAELQVMRNEALGAAQTRIDQNPRFIDIPKLEAEEKRLQGIVSGQTPDDVGSDPDVARLQQQRDAKEKEFETAQDEAVCEHDGTCGTGVRGEGPEYREKRDRADRLKAERDALTAQLAAATTAARQRISTGSVQAQGAAKVELQRIQQELETRRTERTFESDKARAAEIQNDGLLARIEALDRISTGRPLMWVAHLTLILLFVCIELLPVLVKIMSVTGPKSLYEQLVEKRDEDALVADQVWSDKQREIALLRVGVRMDLEQDRADAQTDAGKRSNAVLVAAQEDIAKRAVQVWADVAKRRADHELAAWLAQYGGGQATAGPLGPYSHPAPPVTPSPPPTNGHVTGSPLVNLSKPPVSAAVVPPPRTQQAVPDPPTVPHVPINNVPNDPTQEE